MIRLLSRKKRQKPKPISEYYTAQECADKLGVSRKTIYTWMDSDPPEIPNIKIGRRRLIPKREVNELLKSKMIVS